jgi:hypothetical protein
MKKLLIVFSSVLVLSCGGKKGGGSQDTPEGVANIVFDAAKNKDYSKLNAICAPNADNDSKHICDMKDEDKDSFVEYFSKGKVNGTATVEGDKAKVPIMFGPDGTKEETFNEVKIDGKWYLESF